jgi:hypothetical protein
MSERVFWISAVALLGFLGANSVTPALARGGGGGGGGHAAGGAAYGGHTTGSVGHVGNGSVAFLGPHGIIVGGTRLVNGRFATTSRFATNRNGLGVVGRDGSGNGAAVIGWPYYPAFEAIPVGPTEVSTQPQVIVISGDPGVTPTRTAPDTRLDYSFVAGCHAIPNGYHCDPPRSEAPAQ